MAALLDAPMAQDAPDRGQTARCAPWLILAALPLLAAGLWATWEFTVDDAYITWRYSQHFADGHGPVWNVDEDPVEGFTNFAWMAWHAATAWLGLDLATVAKATSALFGVATLVMLARDAGGRAGSAVAAAAYLLFLPTYFHITGGLETAAFAAVLLRLVVLGVRALGSYPVRVWEPPLLLLAAGTLRPEGAIAAVPAVAVWLWGNRRHRPAWLAVAVAALVGAGYFWWRWSFYGQLLPNTFYVKFGNLTAGQAWLEVTAAALLPLIVLAGALVLRRPPPGLLIAVTVAATYLPYALSGPSMDYAHRFAFHAFPVLCLGAGLAIADAPRRVAALVGVLTVGWVVLAGVTADDVPVIANYGPDLQRTHVAIGEGLAAAAVPAAARTLAVSDAGAIPYYSGWVTVDYVGLNDERITAGVDADDVVAAADPTVIVVTGDGADPPAVAYGLDVAATTAGYRRIADVRMRDGYSQHVFVKPVHAAAVRAAVEPAVAAAQAVHDPGRYDLTFDRWMDRLMR